jgi:hypothetical protein
VRVRFCGCVCVVAGECVSVCVEFVCGCHASVWVCVAVHVCVCACECVCGGCGWRVCLGACVVVCL